MGPSRGVPATATADVNHCRRNDRASRTDRPRPHGAPVYRTARRRSTCLVMTSAGKEEVPPTLTAEGSRPVHPRADVRERDGTAPCLAVGSAGRFSSGGDTDGCPAVSRRGGAPFGTLGRGRPTAAAGFCRAPRHIGLRRTRRADMQPVAARPQDVRRRATHRRQSAGCLRTDGRPRPGGPTARHRGLPRGRRARVPARHRHRPATAPGRAGATALPPVEPERAVLVEAGRGTVRTVLTLLFLVVLGLVGVLLTVLSLL